MARRSPRRGRRVRHLCRREPSSRRSRGPGPTVITSRSDEAVTASASVDRRRSTRLGGGALRVVQLAASPRSPLHRRRPGSRPGANPRAPADQRETSPATATRWLTKPRAVHSRHGAGSPTRRRGRPKRRGEVGARRGKRSAPRRRCRQRPICKPGRATLTVSVRGIGERTDIVGVRGGRHASCGHGGTALAGCALTESRRGSPFRGARVPALRRGSARGPPCAVEVRRAERGLAAEGSPSSRAARARRPDRGARFTTDLGRHAAHFNGAPVLVMGAGRPSAWARALQD